MQDALHRPVMIEGEDHQLRSFQTCCLENAVVSCIAEHDLVTLSARGTKLCQIQFDGDIGDIRRFQDSRHKAADATATTKDDVVVEPTALCTDRYFGRCDVAITMAERPFGPVVALYDERGKAHREGQGNQRGLAQVGRHEAGLVQA